jgi:hypothetical protein
MLGIVFLITFLLSYFSLYVVRTAKQRYAVLFGAVAICATAWLATVQVKGTPKYVEQVEESTVISFVLSEGKAIFLWLDVGSDMPLYVAIPWSREKAEQLIQAQTEAEGNGTVVKVRKSDQTEVEEMMFYPAPVEALPEKS